MQCEQWNKNVMIEAIQLNTPHKTESVSHNARSPGSYAMGNNSDWFTCLAPRRPRVLLTHGEDKGRKPLAALIEQRYDIQSHLPKLEVIIEV